MRITEATPDLQSASALTGLKALLHNITAATGIICVHPSAVQMGHFVCLLYKPLLNLYPP